MKPNAKDLGGLIATFAPAIARGVEVTIITNDHPVPELRFKWRFQDHRDGAIGTFTAAGMKAKVVDCDGDSSYWELTSNRIVIAEGEVWDCSPFYHFDACLLAAENAMMVEARRRLRSLQSLPEGDVR